MSTPSFKIDVEQVSTAGRNLNTASDTLKNGRKYGDATGAEDYEVFDAVGDFRDKWDNALTRLHKSIGDMGDTLTAIANAFKTDDEHRAAGFKIHGGAPVHGSGRRPSAQ